MRPHQQNDIFHAIAHPARRSILGQLKRGEKPAGELVASFGVSFSAVSQHLKILKEAKLVTEQRSGRQRMYYLNSQPLKEVWNWVEDFQELWATRLDALENHLDRKYKTVKNAKQKGSG